MSLSFHSNKESLYLQVYDHYKNLIIEHRLPAGSRMPSLRKCAAELKLSRTTIENAYLQLAADGYIIARAQSGYYVTDIAAQDPVSPVSRHSNLPPVKYDFASNGVDHKSFRFDLWQRYLKSALRQSERLLSYGEPQGEADLRQVLADYIRQRRNVLLSVAKKLFLFRTLLLYREVRSLQIMVLMYVTVTKTVMLFMFPLLT